MQLSPMNACRPLNLGHPGAFLDFLYSDGHCDGRLVGLGRVSHAVQLRPIYGSFAI